MDTMTHEHTNLRPKIALYEPDIPQNTASISKDMFLLRGTIRNY